MTRKFSLNLKPTPIVLRLVLGMQSKEVTIVTVSDNIIKTIVLEEGGIELDGVEIGNASLYKGDTIVYNADSFKTGTEKKKTS
jgi:hypothetical protein